MGRVCIYPSDCADFSTNGLGVLIPEECTVKEIARGQYEVELVHPIDSEGRWRLLGNGCYLKVNTPVRESPEADVTGPGPVVRPIYRVSTPKKQQAQLRTRATTGSGAVIAKVAYGREVVVLSRYNQNWYRVTTRNGITGYMQTAYLEFVRDETENPSKAGQISRRIVAPTPSRMQLFQIYSTEIDTERMRVTCNALHVQYALRTNPVTKPCDFENESAKIALQSCWNGLANPHNFTLHCDTLTGSVTGEFSYKNMVEVLLDPDTGIAAQADARVIRDNFDLYVLDDAPQDHGVTIRRGKNLVGVTAKTSTKDVVTRIIPVGSSIKDTDIVGNAVDSPYINDYPTPLTLVKDYNVKISKKGEIQTEAQLRAKLAQLARDDFAKGIDLPEYTLEVDFTTIPEDMYGLEYAQLNAVFIYDDVTVIDSLIGLKAKVRVVEYQWDALAERYLSIKLGDLGEVAQTVYSYNLPTGKISGTKIAPNSMSGTALRDLSVSYAKITNAAVDQLNANTIQAYRADIEQISAGEITADNIVAAVATITGLYAKTLTAESIKTDELAAALARFGVITAGTAEFDRETVKHLIAQALHVEDAVGEDVFIKNLAIDYAQIVHADVGNLCVKAEDGNYYQLHVDAQGNVTAVQTQVSAGEIENGVTSTGHPIIETQMTVGELNASSFKAVSALINKLDAARIDVGELFASKAFIDKLNTTNIASNTFIRLAIESLSDQINDTDSWVEGLKRWVNFDENGLTQGKAGSVYSTVIDETGYHIRREDAVGYVGSFAREGLVTDGIRMGDIICKKTSNGGWAWNEVTT